MRNDNRNLLAMTLATTLAIAVGSATTTPSATAAMLTQEDDITQDGQTFMFVFNDVELSDGTDGTLLIGQDAKGA